MGNRPLAFWWFWFAFGFVVLFCFGSGFSGVLFPIIMLCLLSFQQSYRYKGGKTGVGSMEYFAANSSPVRRSQTEQLALHLRLVYRSRSVKGTDLPT